MIILLIMLFELLALYVATIALLLSLQSSVAKQINQRYAGKLVFFSAEYKNLIKRNNYYVEMLSVLLPFIDMSHCYSK